MLAAMRLLSTVSLALCAGQTIAHADLGGHYPVPRLAGARKFLREFQGERKWERPIRSEHRQTEGLRERGEIEERQNTNGRCGSRYGSCATGYCCSFEGQVFPNGRCLSLLTGLQGTVATAQTTANRPTVSSTMAVDVTETRSPRVSTRRLSHDPSSEASSMEVLVFMTA